MKALDFDLSQDMKFSPQTGIASFRNSRLIVLDANALGLLRQSGELHGASPEAPRSKCDAAGSN